MTNKHIELQLIEYFISLPENQFTKQILKPLFESMGFHPVEFYGGRDEGGKDLICWKIDEFEEKRLTVVQVKKIKASAAASKAQSFAEIITQLQQAKEKKVASLDGAETIPHSVIFITPYQIDTRALESRFEGLQHLRPLGVKVLDGTNIANLFCKKLPHLIPTSIAKSFNLKDAQKITLSNIPLLNSLHYKKDKDYKSFYIDLDFGVGKINSAVFLEWAFDPKVRIIKASPLEYPIIKEKIELFEDAFKVSCITPTWSQIEAQYIKNERLWNSPINRTSIDDWKGLQLGLMTLIMGLQDAISSLIAALSTRFTVDIYGTGLGAREERIKENQHELNGFLISIPNEKNYDQIAEFIINNELVLHGLTSSISALLIENTKEGLSEISKKNNDKDNKKLTALITSISQNIHHIKSTYRTSNLLKAKLFEEPSYEFSLDCSALADHLSKKQDELKTALRSFKKDKFDKVNLKKVLVEFSKLFEILDLLLKEKHLIDALNPEQKQVNLNSLDSIRNNIAIFDVFKTGINVAILGAAGAGKSTTLEMYARQENSYEDSNHLTLYLPLTKILDPNNQTDLQDLEKLENGLLNYLNQNSITTISIVDFRDEINLFPSSTFIFDGIDEVIKASPWILSAINQFADYYKKTQVIISSRLGGEYLSEIKFLTVTVLPFTDEQLFDFIAGWFEKNQEKILPIKSHLQSNPQVMDVVRNPLLATILCVLAENDIQLPTKEISLYRERANLFFGHYDIHKQIKRTVSHHELLEDVARKIAFKLHSSNIRMASKIDLVEIAAHSLAHNSYKKEQISIAVDELITSCNIISEMSANEEFGFGHLRFQEHLAAEEIVRNRGIEISPFLTSPWWRSVMVLFAQMTDNIVSILDEQLDRHSGLGPATETIQAMLNVRSSKEAKNLQDLIQQYKYLDQNEDETYWNETDF